MGIVFFNDRPPIFLQVLILTLFSVYDPSKEYTYVAIEGSSSSQHSICKHDTPAFMITQIIFEGSLVFVACVLAFKTRNLRSNLGEAKQLGFAMYNVGLVAVIVLLMGSFLDVDRKTVYVIMTVGTFWATVFGSSAFVIPRLLQVQKRSSMRRMSSVQNTSFRSADRSNSFHSYGGPLVVPPTQSTNSRGTFQGGSLYNEPRSQIPVSDISSCAFRGSSDYEAEEPQTKTPDKELSTIPLPRDPNDVVCRTSSFDSDVEENLRDSDSDESLGLGGEKQRGGKQKKRKTSFTKLTISPSESDALQELAEEANMAESIDSTTLRNDIEGSIEFHSGDFVIQLEKEDDLSQSE